MESCYPAAVFITSYGRSREIPKWGPCDVVDRSLGEQVEKKYYAQALLNFYESRTR